MSEQAQRPFSDGPRAMEMCRCGHLHGSHAQVNKGGRVSTACMTLSMRHGWCGCDSFDELLAEDAVGQPLDVRPASPSAGKDSSLSGAEIAQWKALAEAHRQDSEDVDAYVARAEAAEAEVARLTQELAKTNEHDDPAHRVGYRALKAALRTAYARAEAAEASLAVLRGYAQHKDGCAVLKFALEWNELRDTLPCTCGLDAALGASPAIEPPRGVQCGVHEYLPDSTGHCQGCGGNGLESHWGHEGASPAHQKEKKEQR